MQNINAILIASPSESIWGDTYGTPVTTPSIIVGVNAALCIDLRTPRTDAGGQCPAYDITQLTSGVSSYFIALDGDYDHSTTPKLLRQEGITVATDEDGHTICKAQLPSTAHSALIEAVNKAQRLTMHCEFGGLNGDGQKLFSFVFDVTLLNTIWNPADGSEDTPDPADPDYLNTAQVKAYIAQAIQDAIAAGKLQGEKGDTGATGATGATPTIEIGEVTAGELNASFDEVSSGYYVLNLSIPDPENPTLKVGTIQSGETAAASLTLSTSGAYLLNLTLPKGQAGSGITLDNDAWNAEKSYALGAALRHNGAYWYSKQDNNIGNEPPSDGVSNDYWQLIVKDGQESGLSVAFCPVADQDSTLWHPYPPTDADKYYRLSSDSGQSWGYVSPLAAPGKEVKYVFNPDATSVWASVTKPTSAAANYSTAYGRYCRGINALGEASSVIDCCKDLDKPTNLRIVFAYVPDDSTGTTEYDFHATLQSTDNTIRVFSADGNVNSTITFSLNGSTLADVQFCAIEDAWHDECKSTDYYCKISTDSGETYTNPIQFRATNPVFAITKSDGTATITITNNGETSTTKIYDGTTPAFKIGSVSTLAAGSSATATISGTAENPVLNLGIPRGDKGESGDAVSADAVAWGKISGTLSNQADISNALAAKASAADLATASAVANSAYSNITAHAAQSALHVPSSGTTGQILTKTADGSQWQDAPETGAAQSVTKWEVTATDAANLEYFAIRSTVARANNDVVIDWGDGSTTAVATAEYLEYGDNDRTADGLKYIDNPYKKMTVYTGEWESDGEIAFGLQHTYSAAGKYIITINGADYFGISHTSKYNNCDEGTAGLVFENQPPLMSRCLDNDLPIADCVNNLSTFAAGANQLTAIHIPTGMNLDRIENWYGCFEYCHNLTSATGFKEKLAYAKNIACLFNYDDALVTCDLRFPCIFKYSDTLCWVFWHCANLEGDIANFFPKAGLSAGTTAAFAGTFCNCAKLTGTVPAKQLWANHAITWGNVTAAFSGCSDDILEQVPPSWGGNGDEVNTVTGECAYYVAGVDNKVSGDYSSADGTSNTVAGPGSTAHGSYNNIDAGYSHAIGNANRLKGTAVTTTTTDEDGNETTEETPEEAVQNVAIGNANETNYQGQTAVGNANRLYKALNATAVGYLNKVNGKCSLTLGHTLVNNAENATFAGYKGTLADSPENKGAFAIADGADDVTFAVRINKKVENPLYDSSTDTDGDGIDAKNNAQYIAEAAYRTSYKGQLATVPETVTITSADQVVTIDADTTSRVILSGSGSCSFSLANWQDGDSCEIVIDTQSVTPSFPNSWVTNGVDVTTDPRLYVLEVAQINTTVFYTVKYPGAQGTGSSSIYDAITIGDNGHWYINGQDTGYPAQGEKGEKGDTGATGATGTKGDKGDKGDAGTNGTNGVNPVIGSNGNWWIDGQDTGYPVYAAGCNVVLSPTKPSTVFDGLVWVQAESASDNANLQVNALNVQIASSAPSSPADGVVWITE